MLAKKINKWSIASLAVFSVLLLCGFVPYTPDANTVLIDHFDGATSASVLAYSEDGVVCGPSGGSPKPSATPISAYVPGPNGLSQALSLNPPAGQPAGSGTYLQYPNGQLLSQPNGTIEFWTYLTTYGVGFVQQGRFPGACDGWTFSMGVNATGQLYAGAWNTFSMNSGATTVPLNTWTHVAATWGSAGAKLYINGVLVGSAANTGMPASGYNGSVLINLGGGVGLRIDELRISNLQRTTFSTSGLAGTGTHNASGTYTWDTTTGVITFNWTSSDFTCDGPSSGSTSTDTGIVTDTTMTWVKDNMTWTRPSGTAGDIVGTWTSTNSATGNSWTLVFNANGTVSVIGVIVQCGGGGTISFNGWVMTSPNWPVTDGMAAISGATVNALNESSPPPFAFTTTNTEGVFAITGIPALSTFRLVVQPPAATAYVPVLSKFMNWNADVQALLSFVLFTQEQYAAFGNATGTGMILGRVTLKNSPATFLAGAIIEAREWTSGNPPVLGATYPVTYTSGSATQADGIYMVKNVPAGKLVQLVATLPNHTFEFNGAVIFTQPGFVSEESFFATPAQQAVTVSGVVKDWNGNLLPSPGATVTLVGDPTKTTTSSTTDGSFSLSGVPANTPFSLRFSKTGYLDVYTVDITLTADANINLDGYGGSSPINLPTASDLTALGAVPASGKALIVGRVSDQTYRYSSNVGGVVVTATGNVNSYQVTYRDPFGVLSSTPSTWGNGRYYVLNVDGGDTITMTAARSGWNFPPRTFHTQGNAVSQGRIWGTSPGYDASLSGFVRTSAGVAVSGATMALNGDPGKSTTTAGDGSYTFGGLPRDAYFYAKVTASGYVPAYAGPVNLAGSVSGIHITMLTAGEMTGFGVSGSNGLLGCTVMDPSMSPLGGATVTLTSKSGTVYTPNYEGGGGATSATGKFLVPDIVPGDVVKIEAAKSGYTFNPYYLDGFSGAITEKMIFPSAVQQSPFKVYSYHQDMSYFINMFVDDPSHAFTGVTVNGPGLAGDVSLDYVTARGRWEIAASIVLGTTLPTGARTYNFTAATGGTPVTGSKTVSVYVEGFAANLLPTGNVANVPTFSWAGITGATGYGIVVNDMTTGTGGWSSPNLPGSQTSVLYNGPGLITGHTYEYTVISSINTDGNSNSSFARAQFTYTGSTATISFSGMLKDTSDNPIIGAAIEQVGNTAVNTTTNSTGNFTLPGLPSGTPFSVKMTGGATYVPTYSGLIQSTVDMTSPRPFNLFTPSELTGWGVTSGTGLIRGRVVNDANPGAGYISGATVSYTSSLGNTYRVKSEDVYGNLVDGVTTAKGRYYILDVVEGDTVTVSATHPNYPSLRSQQFQTHTGAASQGIISGAAVSGRVAIGGHIMDTAATPAGIKNATIEQVGATAPINATTSNPDGAFYLSVPAATTLQLKFSKPQATTPQAPTYSPNLSFSAEFLGIDGYNLFPATKLGTGTGNWNITPGAGIIRGRVRDQAGSYIGGATVTAQSGIKSYTVCYDDACTPGKSVTDDASVSNGGRFVVKDVDDGDTVTVTALKAGWSFVNTLVFPTHGDSLHQGGITGTQTAATTHPDAAMIQTRFETAMTAFNANNFSQESGFASYISASYLDRGENKTLFVSNAQQERTAHGAKTWTIQSILGAGDYAAMSLTWNDGQTDTMYFRKEVGVWLLYGNQKLFDVWANSGHQMYSTNPYLYWVSLSAEDTNTAGTTITGVNVKGPGLPTEGISLYHDTSSRQWRSWSQSPMEQDLGPKWATAPALPLDYVFTINYTGGTGTSPEVQTFLVKTFVNAAPLQASLTPQLGSTAPRPLTFSWGSAGTGYRYEVEVNDQTTGNRIWSVHDLTGTSVVYDGPALGAGSYVYNLLTQDGFGNMSMITMPFQMPLLYPRTAVTGGTGTDNHPAWSPDGTKIAFTSNRSGIDNIWVVNLNGTGLTQLTTATGTVSAKYPSWSPDGTKIAYISHDASSQIGGFGAFYLNTMNADGTGQTVRPLPPRATQNQADQFWGFEMMYTEWLSDTTVVFVSYGPDGGSQKLYRYDIGNNTVSEITPAGEANSFGAIYKLSWSSVKGLLAFDRYPTGVQTFTPGQSNLQVLNIPRATMHDTPTMPGWSPDGNQMAFVKNLYGASNIGIFNTTSDSAIIEQTATDDKWPVWSPAGESIAFVSDGKIWTMTIVAPTITVTGKVYNWAGTAPLNGATADLLGGDLPRSTTTDTNGNFTFDNIKPNQGFYLRFRSTGLRDVYSGDLSFAGAAGPVDLGTYNLPADTDLAGFGLLTGKGLIMGRVLDQQFVNGGRVGGAVVRATSAGHPAPGYTVTYRDPIGNFGGTATYGNGRYYVLDVDEGDTVTVTATKSNRSPAQRTFHTFGGAVSQGNVRNQAPGYDLSFSGTVYDINGAVVSGARVEIDRYPTKFSTTDAAGAYLLGNLPRDVNMNLRITKDGSVPAYTGGVNLNASLTGIPLTLFTQTNLNNMGVATGNGLIAGRVTNDTLSPLAGARVQAVSNKGQTYTVNYGQGGGTATLADGGFWIPNVLAGDVVTLTVAHPGYIYSGVTYLDGYAGAVTEKLFVGALRKGDINGDGKVDLADAVLALKVAAGMNPTGIRANYPTSGADVNGDGLVGAAEMIGILQYLSGLRP